MDQNQITVGISQRVKSPCIGVCAGLSNKTCQGCGRTFDEIGQWRSMSEAQKQLVWVRINADATALRYKKPILIEEKI